MTVVDLERKRKSGGTMDRNKKALKKAKEQKAKVLHEFIPLCRRCTSHLDKKEKKEKKKCKYKSGAEEQRKKEKNFFFFFWKIRRGEAVAII